MNHLTVRSTLQVFNAFTPISMLVIFRLWKIGNNRVVIPSFFSWSRTLNAKICVRDDFETCVGDMFF